MNPFFVLVGMYAGFAALLFASGYLYKTTRDRRNRARARANEEREKLQRELDFDHKVEKSKSERHETVAVR